MDGAFKHRAYYVNFASHLLNSWNANMMHPGAGNRWGAREFFRRVFGPQHEILGKLSEAFEVVPGWGYYPRRKWSRPEAHRAYRKIIEHLEQATTAHGDLPLFPSPEEYRKDLLCFARMFARLSEESPDREAIRTEYWRRALAIYDSVPMSVDERAESAARGFSRILE